MFNTVIRMSGTITHGKSLETIGAEIVRMAKGVVSLIASMVMELINVAVVPLALLALIIAILFLIISIAVAKRRQVEEGIEEHAKNLMICVVVFLVIGGYGLIFGDLLRFITG